MDARDYPLLGALLDAWFHQDFDLAGDSLEAVMQRYYAVTPVAQRQALQAEIQDLLARHHGNLDAEFEDAFNPQVIPAALAGSVQAFLTQIAHGLSAH